MKHWHHWPHWCCHYCVHPCFLWEAWWLCCLVAVTTNRAPHLHPSLLRGELERTLEVDSCYALRNGCKRDLWPGSSPISLRRAGARTDTRSVSRRGTGAVGPSGLNHWPFFPFFKESRMKSSEAGSITSVPSDWDDGVHEFMSLVPSLLLYSMMSSFSSLWSCVEAAFFLLTTRGRLLWLYRSLCFMW